MIRVAIAASVLWLSLGCRERWDPENPPGVSQVTPSSGAERRSAPRTTEPRPELLEPLDEVHAGELADGDFVLPVDGTLYDVFAFETVAGASIVVTMSSDELQPYLHLMGPDGGQIAHRGIPEGETGPAELVVVAPQTGEYRVYANGAEPAMRGRYELRIVVEAPPRASLPAASPTGSRFQ